MTVLAAKACEGKYKEGKVGFLPLLVADPNPYMRFFVAVFLCLHLLQLLQYKIALFRAEAAACYQASRTRVLRR